MATLKAEKREGRGKYKAFDLRKSGRIPGIVYGKGIADNLSVSLDRKEFLHLLHSGERIVEIDIDGSSRKALIKAVQHGTFEHEILHADFRAIREDEVIEVEVMIELSGEAAGLKIGGMVEQNLYHINIRCLPKDMPEKVLVNIESLDMGDIIYADQLPKLAGVTYIYHGNPPVVSCHHPAGEDVALPKEVGVEAAAEPEVIGEKEREAKAAKEGGEKK
ncbi:MAG: 50S ribosomal protein L25 [Planctomycetota bacterium]|nr:50S ribosomal protein L25 [Planctomycetota bacterium]